MGWLRPPLQQAAFKALQVGVCSVGSSIAKDQTNPCSSYTKDGLTELLKEMDDPPSRTWGEPVFTFQLVSRLAPVAPLNSDMKEETLDHLIPDDPTPDDPMGLGLARAEGSASSGLKPDEPLARAEGLEGHGIKPDEGQQPPIRDESAIAAEKVKRVKKEPGSKELKPSFDPISPASSPTVKKEPMSPSKCVTSKSRRNLVMFDTMKTVAEKAKGQKQIGFRPR